MFKPVKILYSYAYKIFNKNKQLYYIKFIIIIFI